MFSHDTHHIWHNPSHRASLQLCVYSHAHADLGVIMSLICFISKSFMLAVHCRQAARNQHLQSPQQYGVWQVEGLGLVVAFRGTSSWDDVFVDINVKPTPLTSDQGTHSWLMHCRCSAHTAASSVQSSPAHANT